MLTGADEYPFHQTPEPMAFAGTDRNFYDRYFFNGYAADGSIFFAVAFGLYPQLDIMDASVSVVKDGVQHVLRASRHMKHDRAVLEVGPIALEIIKPLEQVRITIAENDGSISGDVTFHVRHAPIEEPRFIKRLGSRAFMDYTRLTQNVGWSGHLTVAGERLELSPDSWWGTRDRSWGIRPVGAPDSQPPADGNFTQFFWVWSPANFQNHVVFAHTNDDEYGRPWNRSAVIEGIGGERHHYEDVEFDITFAPGTRRINALTVDLKGEGGDAQLRYEVKSRFFMSGLGYTHPVWGHGRDLGELKVEHEQFASTDADEGNPLWMHQQGLSSVELDIGGTTIKGAGIVEQLLLGRHDATGLGDLLAPPAEDK